MANHPARQECPALAELVSALRGIPDLRGITLGTVRNDGSRHTAGVAIDIMLDSRAPDEREKAERVIAALVETHPLMGWYDLIYTNFHIPGNRAYAGRHLERTYGISADLAQAHINHVHVDWCDPALRVVPHETTFVYNWPAAAKNTGFGYPFMAAYATADI
jgi:hypothetical protein